MLLEIQSLTKAFGGLKAVDNVTFSVEPQTVTSVLGPNGAGKTTLFNVITGDLKSDSGRVILKGEDITNLPPHKIVSRGLVRSFQIVNIFSQLSVLENVQVAVVTKMGKGHRFFHPVRDVGRQEAADILEIVGLSDQAEVMAGTLSYGDQRIIEIAIALASKPDILLLDEPTAGMGPQETHATIELINKLSKDQGLTIILIEHDMDVVFSVSDFIIVTHQGRVIAQGKPDEVRRDEKVRKIYLGEDLEESSAKEATGPRTSIVERVESSTLDAKPILEVEEVHTFYGLSHILFGLSLSVRDRELVCLLGRNGAGKTTTLKSIMGLVPPKSGRVVFHDQNLVGSRPYQACRQGIGYVPADRRVYQDLTVRKNLEVGQFFQKAGSAWTIDRIYEIFPHLKNIDGRMAGYLSGGERQMLTIARALMGGPKMLLLDEPTEGLAPAVVTMLEEQIRILKQEGTSILLAEQNMKSALSVSDRCYVINKGEIVYSGTVDELRESEEAVNHLTV